MVSLSLVAEDTRVVLIGSSKFSRDSENLPDLPRVEGNLKELGRVLADPTVVGIPSKNITTILNADEAVDVGESLFQASKEATDTLIVYYGGHGLLGRTTPQLFLATKNTTVAAAEFNAIPFQLLQMAISTSRAKKSIVILDYSLSGADFGATMLPANLEFKGGWVIASRPADIPARAPKGDKYIGFTGELLRLLDEGLDNEKSQISLMDIFDTLYRRLGEQNMPVPQLTDLIGGHSFMFARNRKSNAM